MFRNLHPKCSNPSCAGIFDWVAGGRLFRFQRDPESFSVGNERTERFVNDHHVEHFWLCERCAHIYTLAYEPGRGVLIRLLWPELPAAENRMRLPTS